MLTPTKKLQEEVLGTKNTKSNNSMDILFRGETETVTITKHVSVDGLSALYSVDRKDGTSLVDNTTQLRIVYFGRSQEEAIVFYYSQIQNNNVIWY